MSHDLNPYQQMVREVGAGLALEISLLISAADLPKPDRVYAHGTGDNVIVTIITEGEKIFRYIVEGEREIGVGTILRATEEYIRLFPYGNLDQPEAG